MCWIVRARDAWPVTWRPGDAGTLSAVPEAAETEPRELVLVPPLPDGADAELGFLTRVDEFDDRVDAWFDRLRGHPLADRAFYAASELGDFSLLWHLIGVGRAMVSTRHERSALRLAVALGAESALVNGAIKSIFKRQRPVAEFDRPLHLRIPRTSSFPSGHASSATMAAVLLAEKSRFGPVYRAAAAIVALSRIHVRIHHASDVAGGVGVGWLLGRVVKRLWRI